MENPVSSRHAQLAGRARTIVAQRFTERLRLSELAAECRVSPWFLAKVFRRVTGMTIHAYQDRLRLHFALERIPECADLTTLALDLGYSSHSHFTAAFRRLFGTTPARYRSGHRGEQRLPRPHRRAAAHPGVDAARREVAHEDG